LKTAGNVWCAYFPISVPVAGNDCYQRDEMIAAPGWLAILTNGPAAIAEYLLEGTKMRTQCAFETKTHSRAAAMNSSTLKTLPARKVGEGATAEPRRHSAIHPQCFLLREPNSIEGPHQEILSNRSMMLPAPAREAPFLTKLEFHG
jgi:hypothetical protein